MWSRPLNHAETNVCWFTPESKRGHVESRIMTGFHYRFSIDIGASMGDQVANKVLQTQLRPR